MKNIITYKYKEPIYIVTLFDLHIGAPTFKLNNLLTTIDFIKENKNAYYILGGDMIENITPDTKAIATDQDIFPDEQLSQLFSLLDPIRDKCLAVVEGNHEKRTRKRSFINIAKIIATMLQVPFLGSGGVINVEIEKQKYSTVIHHGASAAANWTTEMWRMLKIYQDADIYLAGHNHTLAYKYIPYISCKGKTEIDMYKIFIRGGNYLGYADYAREKTCEMKPTGSAIIYLHDTYRKILMDTMLFIGDELIG